MWEYKRIDITYKSHSELEEELNKLGDDNWEVIYYFEVPTEKYETRREVEILIKRPKINENKNSN
jgi:hypothetical protein